MKYVEFYFAIKHVLNKKQVFGPHSLWTSTAKFAYSHECVNQVLKNPQNHLIVETGQNDSSFWWLVAFESSLMLFWDYKKNKPPFQKQLKVEQIIQSEGQRNNKVDHHTSKQA